MDERIQPATAEELIEQLRRTSRPRVPHETTADAAPETTFAESGPGGGGSAACTPFLGTGGTTYRTYVRPQTTGRVQVLIHGRSSGGTGPDVDRLEPLVEMERVVKATTPGDRVLLSAWFCEPATLLTGAPYHGATDWGGLFVKKAREGVVIRILINDFDPVSGLDQWLERQSLAPLRALVGSLPAPQRDNLKFIVSRHPAHIGRLKSALASVSGPVYIASHHQKFMAVRRGESVIAFCGGLDIESRKHPSKWSYSGLAAWHDVHLRLDGRIAYDVEYEFVMRWNRERAAARNRQLPGWRGFEALRASSLSRHDVTDDKRVHRVQLTRTVSSDATLSPFSNDRDDIRQAYRRIIGCASRYLYFENQYFRSPGLADEIVRQGRARPQLKVIMVVVESAAADDGANPVTSHGDHLQYETFRRVVQGLGASRVRLYTMFGRAVHAKLVLADDRVASIGSANANERGFQLDSELNITIDDSALVRDTRLRLWSFWLGESVGAVGRWAASSFLAEWDRVARANQALRARPHDMQGAGIVPYDYTRIRGSRSSLIPDYIANFDFGTEKTLFAGRLVTGPPGRPLVIA